MPWRTTASHPDTDSVLWHLARIEQASSLNTSLSVMIITTAQNYFVSLVIFSQKTMNVVMVSYGIYILQRRTRVEKIWVANYKQLYAVELNFNSVRLCSCIFKA